MPMTIRETEKVEEHSVQWVGPRPITFEEYVRMFSGRDQYVELVDGVVVEKPMVQLDHESIEFWLKSILAWYAKERDLGSVHGSRYPVKLAVHGGRLPDILFVSKARAAIVQQMGAFGAPDIVIEIVSPNDRKAHLVALESDYCALGVPEICFIDTRKRIVRLLRKSASGYDEFELRSGTLTFNALSDLAIELTWLFDEPRPDVPDLLAKLRAEGASSTVPKTSSK